MNDDSKPGLKSFRVKGNPKSNTAPTPDSRTQARKAALKAYSADERKNGKRA